jgi:hypothetical protein
MSFLQAPQPDNGYSFLYLILIVSLILYVRNYFEKKKKEKKDKITQALKVIYYESLKGSDKKLALDNGRLYYASLREDGKLSIYDESAIANDIATMS